MVLRRCLASSGFVSLVSRAQQQSGDKQQPQAPQDVAGEVGQARRWDDRDDDPGCDERRGNDPGDRRPVRQDRAPQGEYDEHGEDAGEGESGCFSDDHAEHDVPELEARYGVGALAAVESVLGDAWDEGDPTLQPNDLNGDRSYPNPGTPSP